jgi:hypothetical protein
MSQDLKSQVKRLKSPDGTVRFIKDGKLHNAEGPAVIHSDGKEEYHINGFQYTKDEFKKLKKESVGLPWYKSGSSKARH